MQQAVSLVTPGVADPERGKAFHEFPGRKAAPESVEGNVVLFQANGFVLGLYAQDALSKDMYGYGRNATPGGITIAQNFDDEAWMRTGYDALPAAGESAVRAPFAAPWGTIAYVADPDGHVREFGRVPGFEPDAAGDLALPSAR